MNEKTELSDEQILYLARHAADRIPASNYEGRVLHAVRMALAASPSSKSTKEAPFATDALETAIDEYLADYEMVGEAEDGRDACYQPTEGERILLKDAILGLLADPGWDAEWGKLIEQRAAALASSSIKEDGERAEPVAVQYQRRRGFGDGSGVLNWGEWRPCTEQQARRVAGLRSWQWRKIKTSEPHCRVEQIHLTDEQRKLLTVSRPVSIPGASSPPSPLGDTPDQQEQKR